MAVISCDLRLVTDKAASVTELLVRAPRVRASGVKTVVTAPDRVPVTNGTASFTALPGPCVVTLVALGTPIATMDLLVPDVASTTLVECILAGELAENAEVSELRALSEQVLSKIAEKVDRITTASVVLATNASGAQSSVPYSQSATENSIVQRDSGGRAQVADPSAAQDIATKGYVDSGLSGKAAASHTHTSDQISDATSAPTANMVVKRDASGRAQVVDPSAAADIVTKQYADNLVDWNNTLQHRLWGHVPFILEDGISVDKVWIGSQGGYAATTGYVDSGGTPSEATMSMWGATWYFTKVGKTVFVSTNGTNIDTRQWWEFTTPIPDGYRPKYEQRLHFGDGTASCKIFPNGSLTSLADYVAPVSFSYLAA